MEQRDKNHLLRLLQRGLPIGNIIGQLSRRGVPLKEILEELKDGHDPEQFCEELRACGIACVLEGPLLYVDGSQRYGNIDRMEREQEAPNGFDVISFEETGDAS